MRTSVEVIITELGISSQPFQESFKKYGKWITWSWMTSVWEKFDLFGVKVELENNVIKFPRQGDKWLMILFVLAGFSKEDLKRLNRVRVHRQVLFLSCILGASGKNIGQKVLKKTVLHRNLVAAVISKRETAKQRLPSLENSAPPNCPHRRNTRLFG